MQSWRKFWGRVTSGRWKVINSDSGRVVASFWTRKAAQDYSSDCNDTLAYVGAPSRYVARWM